MSGIKPRIGLKFRVPRIGICKIIGVDHNLLCCLAKRGRRKMLISYSFFREITGHNKPYTVEFTCWTDNVDMNGYTGLSIASMTMRLKDPMTYPVTGPER